MRVKINPAFFRPAEVELLIGDATRAENELGWVAKTELGDSVRSWSKPTSGEINLDFRSDRILLTGSEGFTGHPLAPRLRHEGHHVIGLTRHPGEAGELSGDLCDADWVRRVVADVKPTVVVHLAGVRRRRSTRM